MQLQQQMGGNGRVLVCSSVMYLLRGTAVAGWGQGLLQSSWTIVVLCNSRVAAPSQWIKRVRVRGLEAIGAGPWFSVPGGMGLFGSDFSGGVAVLYGRVFKLCTWGGGGGGGGGCGCNLCCGVIVAGLCF